MASSLLRNSPTKSSYFIERWSSAATRLGVDRKFRPVSRWPYRRVGTVEVWLHSATFNQKSALGINRLFEMSARSRNPSRSPHGYYTGVSTSWGQIFGCVDCFATCSRAASLHCNARLISMSRTTRSSHRSAARVQAAAWSS